MHVTHVAKIHHTAVEARYNTIHAVGTNNLRCG